MSAILSKGKKQTYFCKLMGGQTEGMSNGARLKCRGSYCILIPLLYRKYMYDTGPVNTHVVITDILLNCVTLYSMKYLLNLF